MTRRLKFHQILEEVLESDQVFFQPPSTIKMKYPAILYQKERIDTKLANDELYGQIQGYMVTVIDIDPDSKIPDKILKLSNSSFNRHYTANNLNHDVFTVYY